MRAFYGSKISPHLTKTPEGYLICVSVPICRTGTQEYLPREIGLNTGNQNLIEVYRTPQEVFKPAAVASFEGKPVTDDHPPVALDATNYSSYMKGAVQNVHRGTGEDNDKLFCDLVIYDSNLVSEIESGKREISCGYDCKYIPNDDGSFYQADIIGNHVAIVESGRAGHEVAIRDAKPKGGRKMAKKGILHRMFAAFCKDADPDEIREAAKAVDDAENAEAAKETAEEQPKENHEERDKILEAVDGLNDRIDALKGQPDAEDDEPEDDEETGTEAMDDLEEELQEEKKPVAADDDDESDGNGGEESVTVPPEEIKDDDPEDGDENGESAPDPESQEAHDRALTLRLVRKLKPIVATLPKAQRRKASDTLSRELRKALKKKVTQPLPGGYGSLTKHKVNDAAIQADYRSFGENCRKFNPHLKNKGGK